MVCFKASNHLRLVQTCMTNIYALKWTYILCLYIPRYCTNLCKNWNWIWPPAATRNQSYSFIVFPVISSFTPWLVHSNQQLFLYLFIYFLSFKCVQVGKKIHHKSIISGSDCQSSLCYFIAFISPYLFVCFFRSSIVIWLLVTFSLARTKCAKFLTLDLHVV